MSNKLIKESSSKKDAGTPKKTWIIAIAIVVIIIAVVIGLKGGKLKSGDSSSEEETGIQLPYWSGEEDKSLAISSLYQFSGPNPDCNNEDGEDIAALTVTNNTEKLLKSAEITVTLGEKTVYHFQIEYLPAGKTVQAFDTNNTVYSVKDEDAKKIPIEDIKIDDTYEDKADLMEGQVLVEVNDNETEVKLTNQSDKDIEDLVMRCHTLFDEEYFGGLTYKYEVGSIPAGNTVTYDAVDCYLGTAEVVELTTK